MRALLATVIAVVAVLAVPVHADALSPARTAAAASAAREVGHHGLHGPASDRAMVLGAWRDAGVDIRGLGTPDDLLHACTFLDVSAPRPAGPAPADYALYRDGDGAERIGMFVSPVDVVVVDAGSVVILPRPELSGDIGELAVPRLMAQRGSLRACRLSPQRWPGGVDDTSITVGRIALADAGQTSEHLHWAAEHPRDAEQNPMHAVQHILAAIAAGISGVLWQLAQALVDAVHWLIERLGPVGAPALFVLNALGSSFDGRRLHAILTGLVLAAIGFGVVMLVPFGWIAVGAVLAGAAASAAGAPLLGAIGGALLGAVFAIASFLVSTFTGIDDNSRVCVGTVLFALVADLLWVRPMLAALSASVQLGRFAAVAHVLAPIERLRVVRAVAGEGRSLLDLSGTFTDAVSLRPHGIAQGARAVRDGLALARDTVGAAPRAAVAAAPTYHAMSAGDALLAGSRRSLDLLSLAWRPSSATADLVGHTADALRLLDAELRAGLPSMPRLRQALLAMEPQNRTAVLGAARQLSVNGVPAMQMTARLSHLHSGARTVAALGNHQQQPRPWSRLAHSPVLRRLWRGLPAAAP